MNHKLRLVLSAAFLGCMGCNTPAPPNSDDYVSLNYDHQNLVWRFKKIEAKLDALIAAQRPCNATKMEWPKLQPEKPHKD